MPGLSAASLAVVHVWGISKTREMHAPRQEATSGRIKVFQNLLRIILRRFIIRASKLKELSSSY